MEADDKLAEAIERAKTLLAILQEQQTRQDEDRCDARPLQLYYVFNDRHFFDEDKVEAEEFVLARREAEARMLVREDYYRNKRSTPQKLKVIPVPMDGKARILNRFEEGARLKSAEEEV